MGASMLLDHLVIAVTDLQQAISDYRELGFNVAQGGRHQHAPTQNALIYFADGTYLELIEWTAPAPGEKWYERLSRHGEGLVDFAFVPSQIGKAIEQAKACDVIYDGPNDGSRMKASGELVRWQLGWPLSYALPFLCGDITPRSLRVPEGDVRLQPNGVSGIPAIAIRVDDLEVAEQAYRGLLGPESEATWGARQTLKAAGLDVLSLQLAGTRLHLVAPSKDADAVPNRAFLEDLRSKGQGVYQLCLSGVNTSALRLDRARLSHGVSLVASRSAQTLPEQVGGRYINQVTEIFI
jgi:catechol 2,3-dioxygenase-like lactoylglutathione lyase family enzyme